MALMYTAYLRPSELMHLRVKDILMNDTHGVTVNLAPGDTEFFTKTGTQDEAIPVENMVIPWLGALLKERLRDMGFSSSSTNCSSEPLWSFNYETLKQVTKRCVERLQLPADFCLYMMRHGGVTTDLLRNYRDALACKTRGRWQSDGTFKRYCKAGIVACYLAMCQKSVVAFGERIGANLHLLRKAFEMEHRYQMPVLPGRAGPKTPSGKSKAARAKAAAARAQADSRGVVVAVEAQAQRVRRRPAAVPEVRKRPAAAVEGVVPAAAHRPVRPRPAGR